MTSSWSEPVSSLTSVAETSGELTDFVCRPTGRVSLREALDLLVWHDVTVRLETAPDTIAGHLMFLTAVRGALGHALLESASSAVRDGDACTFSPACAADLLFLTRKIPGGPEISAPFVPLVDRVEGEIALTIRLFGIATGWSGPVSQALVRAVERGIGLPDGRRETFGVGHLQVSECRVAHDVDGANPSTLLLTSLTPIASSGASDLDGEWTSLILSFLTRARNVLRWHGCLIDASWPDLRAYSSSQRAQIDKQTREAHSRQSSRRSGHHLIGGQHWRVEVQGDFADLLPLLLIGTAAGVGRRTSFGLGRIALAWGRGRNRA